MIKKIIFIFLGLVFLSFCIVQYNDPDPVIWICIYSIPIYLLYKKYGSTQSKSLYFVIASIYILWAFNQFPPEWEGVTLNYLGMKTLNIELGRESLGLGFCGIVIAAIAFYD